MTTYNVIFDARSTFTEWRISLFPAALAVFCALCAFLAWKWREGKPRRVHRQFFLYAGGAAFSAVLAIGVFVMTWREHRQLVDALNQRRFVGVEGVIEDFKPEPPGGHGTESFRVGDRTYTYSTYRVTSAFHWTHDQDGPIHNGLKVRIADVDGKIARLELAP